MAASGMRIGIHSHGLWQKRRAVAALLGGSPVLALPGAKLDVIAGWGHKQSARQARADAARRQIPYIAIEDGFLRSVQPGSGETAIGWIVDRSGIYYDAKAPGDLRAAIVERTKGAPRDTLRAADARRLITQRHLSKYNHAPMLPLSAMGLPSDTDVVLVVDQTFGDASVAGAGANEDTFKRMLAAAMDESGGRPVVVKIHPEAVSGQKKGYLTDATRQGNVHVVAHPVNPWALIESAVAVYTVSSQLGFEALLAGRRVVCFGQSMYSGLGLTDDRFDGGAPQPTPRAVTIDDLTAAAFFDYCRWIDPFHETLTTFEHAADILTLWRDRHIDNTRSVCVGFSRWKRRAVREYLRGAGGEPRFQTTASRQSTDVGDTGRIVVWGSRARALSSDARTHRNIVTCEDGFLRSVGLGATFTRPMSLVFDEIGIYYDATRPSRFEQLATETRFSDALLARARALAASIIDNGLSKYNDTTASSAPPVKSAQRTILVPGQVEGDASIMLGSPVVKENLRLLQDVRQRWPDAQIIYKPHPDVEAGLRKGKIADSQALALADRIVTNASITELLKHVDHVETITSLAGFEALLRGRSVTTHGIPFYSGWGLTEDLATCERRTRRLAVDELVAVALILYPRYIDPVTRLPCEPELIVERLIEARERQFSIPGQLALAARRSYALIAHKAMAVLRGG